jgi:DNA ligase (NAD+)
MMNLAKAQERHAQLAEEIREHDHAYYVLARPRITDMEYDRLYRELLELEQRFPALITPDSPSQKSAASHWARFSRCDTGCR